MEQFEQIRELPKDIHFKKIVSEWDPQAREPVAKIVFFPDGSATWAEISLENRSKRKGAGKRLLNIEVPCATAMPNVKVESPETPQKEQAKQEKEHESPEAEFRYLDRVFEDY